MLLSGNAQRHPVPIGDFIDASRITNTGPESAEITSGITVTGLRGHSNEYTSSHLPKKKRRATNDGDERYSSPQVSGVTAINKNYMLH